MGMMGSQSGRPVSGVSEVGRDGPRQRDRNRDAPYPKGSGGGGSGDALAEPVPVARAEDLVELSEAVLPMAEADVSVPAPVEAKPPTGGLDIQA